VKAGGDMVQGVARDPQFVGGPGVVKAEVGDRLQRPVEPVSDQPLVRRVAVQFKTQFVEASRAQAVVDDIQRRHFLGDEKNRFPGMHGGGDHIRDGLRFACARRPVHNEIVAGPHAFDDARLR
jgi:hypothetical protein